MRNLAQRAKKINVRKATKAKASKHVKVKIKGVKHPTVVPVRHANLAGMQDNAPKMNVAHSRSQAMVTARRVRRTITPTGRSSIHVLRFALEGRSVGLDEAPAPVKHEPLEHHQIQPMKPFEIRLKPGPQRLRISRRSADQPSLLRRLQYQMDLLEMSEALQ
jgi:hypothetical protein